jgi:hypothetical protein
LRQYALNCIASLLAREPGERHAQGKSNNVETLGYRFFLLAIASVLATLFAVLGSGPSPGLFLAVVLAGVGKWLLSKSQEKSARETFGRAIEVAETGAPLETPHD